MPFDVNISEDELSYCITDNNIARRKNIEKPMNE